MIANMKDSETQILGFVPLLRTIGTNFYGSDLDPKFMKGAELRTLSYSILYWNVRNYRVQTLEYCAQMSDEY